MVEQFHLEVDARYGPGGTRQYADGEGVCHFLKDDKGVCGGVFGGIGDANRYFRRNKNMLHGLRNLDVKFVAGLEGPTQQELSEGVLKLRQQLTKLRDDSPEGTATAYDNVLVMMDALGLEGK